MKKVDILIVGQGIAGTVLAYQAMKRNLSVHVIDKPLPGYSTLVAGGIINPVTGRRLVKSWNFDLFYESSMRTYHELDEFLNIHSLHSLPIYKLLKTTEDVNDWELKRVEPEYQDYMKNPIFKLDERITTHQGAGILTRSAWIDTRLLLSSFRNLLKKNDQLTEDEFDYCELKKNKYKDIEFDKIIFCEGHRIDNNPFFEGIHLWSTKGEVLTIKIEGEDFDYIINKMIYIIPLSNGKYKVGATLDREINTEITEKGKNDLVEKINSILKVPYKIIEQETGIRPNVRDRKPLLGVSTIGDNYFLLNGLGSKGISLAPYFAKHLLEFIYNNQPLQQDINWQRVFKEKNRKAAQ
ncbi:MAG: FAD-binding oxidoreductase [Chitinophagales bacterium]|nr:FAD-binding oxidoreductase [Chitinophagales bacterium]